MLFSGYCDYFENLAVQNKAIGHTIKSEKSSFFWILVSADPFPHYYLDHLEEAQRNKIPAEKPFLVLENYTAAPDIQNRGDYSNEMMGAFMVLQKAEKKEAAEKTVLDYTERVAMQIVARMILDMKDKCSIDLLNKFKYEHIGPAMGGNYFGTKVYFNMKDASAGIYSVDESEWKDL